MLRKTLIIALMTMPFGHFAKAQVEFPYPHIPDSIAVNYDRLSWMLNNFWNNFNFRNESANNLKVGEQGLVDYINLMGNADSIQAATSASIFANRLMTIPRSSIMRKVFKNLAEHYLDNPYSPMRNDRTYATLIEAVAAMPDNAISSTERIRLLDKSRLLRLNLPGNKASNFTLTTPDGKEKNLQEINADLLLLYFYDPDCEQCKKTQRHMEQSGIFKDKRLQILRVNPTDYDLAGRLLYWFDRMPSLYLLDKDKRVILKDATIEETEEKLREILK
jgi:hypothetical protein